METTLPRSLYGTFAATLAATTSGIALAVISAALAGSLAMVSTSGSDDDRGSGRVSQSADLLIPGLLAIRGSGRVGSDPDQPSSHSSQKVVDDLAWRGSGRINEDPTFSGALTTLRA